MIVALLDLFGLCAIAGLRCWFGFDCLLLLAVVCICLDFGVLFSVELLFVVLGLFCVWLNEGLRLFGVCFLGLICLFSGDCCDCGYVIWGLVWGIGCCGFIVVNSDTLFYYTCLLLIGVGYLLCVRVMITRCATLLWLLIGLQFGVLNGWFAVWLIVLLIH